MTSVPLNPESVVVEVPGDETQPAVASGAWRLEDGWYLIVTLSSLNGVARVQSVAIEHYGDVTVAQLDDKLQTRNDLLSGEPTPVHEFRYRWVRDIGQQFETQLRQVMAGKVPGMRWLAMPSAFSRRPRRPRQGRGPVFYAEMGRLFVHLGGSLQALADHERVPWSTAKEWVTRATADGYLTSPGRGRRGARQLTEKAEQLLTEEV